MNTLPAKLPSLWTTLRVLFVRSSSTRQTILSLFLLALTIPGVSFFTPEPLFQSLLLASLLLQMAVLGVAGTAFYFSSTEYWDTLPHARRVMSQAVLVALLLMAPIVLAPTPVLAYLYRFDSAETHIPYIAILYFIGWVAIFLSQPQLIPGGKLKPFLISLGVLAAILTLFFLIFLFNTHFQAVLWSSVSTYVLGYALLLLGAYRIRVPARHHFAPAGARVAIVITPPPAANQPASKPPPVTYILDKLLRLPFIAHPGNIQVPFIRKSLRRRNVILIVIGLISGFLDYEYRDVWASGMHGITLLYPGSFTGYTVFFASNWFLSTSTRPNIPALASLPIRPELLARQSIQNALKNSLLALLCLASPIILSTLLVYAHRETIYSHAIIPFQPHPRDVSPLPLWQLALLLATHISIATSLVYSTTAALLRPGPLAYLLRVFPLCLFAALEYFGYALALEQPRILLDFEFPRSAPPSTWAYLLTVTGVFVLIAYRLLYAAALHVKPHRSDYHAPVISVLKTAIGLTTR